MSRMVRIDDDVVAILEVPSAATEGHLRGTLACLQLLYNDQLDVEQDERGFLIVKRFRA